MDEDCDPTGAKKRNLIMKLSRDANSLFDAPNGKWNEGSWWNEDRVLVIRLAIWSVTSD